MKIILLGYMGTGKSTVGKALAQKKNIKFLDLDQYIEEKEKLSTDLIFENKGAIYFRKTESENLCLLLNEPDAMVLSLGGGTPCFGDNMKNILENPENKVIYLRSSVTTLTNRIFPERQHRPLVARFSEKEKLQEFIGQHLFERSYFYNQSPYKISTDGKSLDEIIVEIEETIAS